MRVARTFGPGAVLGIERVSETLPDLEDYLGRGGYVPGFVDPAIPLALPGVGGWADDLVHLLPAAREGRADTSELRYTHFSVKMSQSRKLPLFSACNIDGSLSDRDIERTDIWVRDPRIDTGIQVLRGPYGNEKKGLFSRGHMTRREDPNWGDEETAKQADVDTFTITNVAPQRQGFNGGIWLDLEDYVLDNTDNSNQRISVLTGPVLESTDPVYYGMQVPIDFWKIIVFTNAETSELTTIGYRRSQLTYLPKTKGGRFVFGDFDDTQVSIASIAEDTGLDLTAYAEHDVMAGAAPSMAVRLNSVHDMYLRR